MRAKIVDSAKRGAANISDIGKPSDKASRSGRSRFQAFSAWMRPRSGTIERRMRGPYTRLHGRIPQAGRLTRWSRDPMQFRDATRVRRKGSPPTIACEVRSPKNHRGPSSALRRSCSTFRRVGDFGRNPSRAGAILALGVPTDSPPIRTPMLLPACPQAKIVTAQRVFHHVRGSKSRTLCGIAVMGAELPHPGSLLLT